MYAVIKTGGKQYRVAAGEKLKIEQITADVGQEITLDHVLAIGSGADLQIGSPLVTGASVTVAGGSVSSFFCTMPAPPSGGGVSAVCPSA